MCAWSLLFSINVLQVATVTNKTEKKYGRRTRSPMFECHISVVCSTRLIKHTEGDVAFNHHKKCTPASTATCTVVLKNMIEIYDI